MLRMDLNRIVSCGIFPIMKTLGVDDRQRVRLPKAKAGQVFAYEPNPDGTIRRQEE